MANIDNLKVSKEVLETAITSFETRKMGLELAYLKISNEIRTLDGTWEGKASEDFKRQFDSMYKNLEQSGKEMEEIIKNLKDALSTYEAQEDAAANLINSIDEGTGYNQYL